MKYLPVPAVALWVLIRAIFPLKLFFECYGGRRNIWTSKTAWSILLLIIFRSKLDGKKINLYVPDYYCGSTLGILNHGKNYFNIVYYRLNEKLQFDPLWAEANLHDEGCDIFILVHYFGLDRSTKAAKSYCNRKGAWLIEDAAHVFMPYGSIGLYGDFSVYSPHKMYGLPEGAVLTLNKNYLEYKNEKYEELFVEKELRVILNELNDEFSKSINLIAEAKFYITWFLKNIYRALLKRQYIPSKKNDTTTPGSNLVVRPKLASYFKRVIYLNIRYRQRHAISRRNAFLRLIPVADGNYCLKEVLNEFYANQAFTPYLLPISKNSDAPYEDDFYMIQWPDLPDPRSSNWVEPKSKILDDYLKVKFIYTHQDLTGCFKMAINNQYFNEDQILKSINKYQLTIVDEKKIWEKFFSGTSLTNVLQTFAWGEAKKIQGFEPIRYVIHENGECIGVAQILLKKYLKFFYIAYLNRPLIDLKKLSSAENYITLIELLRMHIKKFSIFHIFLFIPYFTNDNQEAFNLINSKYRLIRSSLPWKSSWIDLSREIIDIRSGLSSKWRNLLSLSERNLLQVVVSKCENDFSELLANVNENFLNKNIQPVDEKFYKKLFKEAELLVFKCFHKGDFISSLSIALHGDSATYLFSWSSEAGRSNNANYFLLWSAILELKKGGYKNLDLGGIDHINNAAVAHFKDGLAGVEYELTGAYWDYGF